ncbi:MAG: SprT family zinc-dependent metalloprotease [Desulfotomaculaceae bacterium]
MNIKKLCLTRPLSDVEVIIERKSVKKIRLKVFPNGIVKLSAPLGVSDECVSDFLKSKTKWIEKSLNNFKDTGAVEFETRIHSGVSTRVLGRQIRIIVNEAKTYKIEQKEGYVYIQSPTAGDKQALQKQFDRWWQKQSKSYFLVVIDRFYPIIAKHGIDKPALQVRKMKTLWGSCSRKHSKINLNYYLYKAPPPCIDYVVLHELTHFLYPKHNKDFNEFLTVHMPDWQERKRILDHEIVKGLGY